MLTTLMSNHTKSEAVFLYCMFLCHQKATGVLCHALSAVIMSRRFHQLSCLMDFISYPVSWISSTDLCLLNTGCHPFCRWSAPLFFIYAQTGFLTMWYNYRRRLNSHKLHVVLSMNRMKSKLCLNLNTYLLSVYFMLCK